MHNRAYGLRPGLRPIYSFHLGIFFPLKMDINIMIRLTFLQHVKFKHYVLLSREVLNYFGSEVPR